MGVSKTRGWGSRLFRSTQMLQAVLLSLLAWGTMLQAQGATPVYKDYEPPELQFTDPEIKAVVDSTKSMQQNGEYEAVTRELQNALQLSIRKKLRTDRALLEALLARVSILRGDLTAAKSYLISAEGVASDVGNLVLEAHVLASLSDLARAEHDTQKAYDLGNRAVDLARKSKSLWVQAYCLGELAYLQMSQQELAQARSNLEEALRIDKLNRYEFEARHTLYMALLEFLTGNNLERGITWATSAKDQALKSEDFTYFIQSSTVLARALAQKGQLEQGLATLEEARRGINENGAPLFQHQSAYLKFVSFPLNQVALLEALAGCYASANQTAGALRAWQELFQLGTDNNISLASAEAAHSIADIYQRQKDRPAAIKWYAIAVDEWKNGGNETRQMDAMASEAFLLNQDQQLEKAIQQQKALVSLAKSNGDKRREFIYTLALAETLQRSQR